MRPRNNTNFMAPKRHPHEDENNTKKTWSAKGTNVRLRTSVMARKYHLGALWQVNQCGQVAKTLHLPLCKCPGEP